MSKAFEISHTTGLVTLKVFEISDIIRPITPKVFELSDTIRPKYYENAIIPKFKQHWETRVEVMQDVSGILKLH